MSLTPDNLLVKGGGGGPGTTKLDVNFATNFRSTFQCLNYCKQMFINKLKLTIQWKVLGPVGYQEGLYFIELVIIIEYEHLFTTCKLLLRSSRPISELGKVLNWQVRNKLGKRTLKSDLKSTISCIG
jgi:hypothetical protein